MPASWGLEAVKAQAVAARSYTAARLGSADGFDICDTTACQVYPGLTSSNPEHPNSDAAVAATSGQVRKYGSAIAVTEFSSTNGGQVVGSTLAYQVAKADPYDGVYPEAPDTWAYLTLPVSAIEKAWPTIGTFRSMTLSRDGKGAWFGGRATALTLTGTSGTTGRRRRDVPVRAGPALHLVHLGRFLGRHRLRGQRLLRRHRPRPVRHAVELPVQRSRRLAASHPRRQRRGPRRRRSSRRETSRATADPTCSPARPPGPDPPPRRRRRHGSPPAPPSARAGSSFTARGRAGRPRRRRSRRPAGAGRRRHALAVPIQRRGRAEVAGEQGHRLGQACASSRPSATSTATAASTSWASTAAGALYLLRFSPTGAYLGPQAIGLRVRQVLRTSPAWGTSTATAPSTSSPGTPRDACWAYRGNGAGQLPPTRILDRPGWWATLTLSAAEAPSAAPGRARTRVDGRTSPAR